MEQNTHEAWVQTKPYTAMLRSYEQAAEKLRMRRAALTVLLRAAA